ncbi:hypothetical protein [Aurantiacibacter spongiae]|uniref:Uncharacterized protein n=1 Tax=Aurantiacibacter spongiae TaxID=2488860 RepID=A0A3N5CT56_9SPHN|nr:hypothetical protein [Aurantiacibacter spongiae]RPF70550.1 hypothetical protein EG799_02120 [Aurantiacibacter spongiae]
MKAIRIVAALTVAAFAPLVALQAMGNSGVPSPAVAWNGFNVAKLALTRLNLAAGAQGAASPVTVAAKPTQATSPQPALDGFKVRPPGMALAHAAYAKEPLASDAAFLFTVDAMDRGDTARANRLLALTGDLDKRNSYTGLLQIQAALERDDLNEAFAVIDRIAVVKPSFVPAMVASIAPLLSNPGMARELAVAFERDPVWANDFWLLSSRVPTALEGLLALRRLTDTGVTEASDSGLLTAAVRQKRFADALAIWRGLPGNGDNDLAYIDSEEYAPVGWQFEKGGRKTMAKLLSGGYRVFAASNSTGEIGRQLLDLRPGTYRLVVDGDADTVSRMQATLQCADAEQADRWRDTGEALEFTVSDTACSVYWLKIGVNTWEDRSDLDGNLTRLSFTKIN